MFNDFLSVFEGFFPWHQEREEAEALALKAETNVRQLSGLPPRDAASDFHSTDRRPGQG